MSLSQKNGNYVLYIIYCIVTLFVIYVSEWQQSEAHAAIENSLTKHVQTNWCTINTYFGARAAQAQAGGRAYQRPPPPRPAHTPPPLPPAPMSDRCSGIVFYKLNTRRSFGRAHHHPFAVMKKFPLRISVSRRQFSDRIIRTYSQISECLWVESYLLGRFK